MEHFAKKCERIRMIRERHRVRGGAKMEKVLLFEGRTEEMVERFTKMLEELWQKE